MVGPGFTGKGNTSRIGTKIHNDNAVCTQELLNLQTEVATASINCRINNKKSLLGSATHHFLLCSPVPALVHKGDHSHGDLPKERSQD